MKDLRRAVLWATLMAIALLFVLSIYGAFIGAARASQFFASVPLAVYWILLTALLIAGIVLFRRLLRKTTLLLMHLGCTLVLIGGIWGSDAGHALAKRLFGTDKIDEGQMTIREGATENLVIIRTEGLRYMFDPQGRMVVLDAEGKALTAEQEKGRIARLPFSLRLNDFRMEYYRPGHLVIQGSGSRLWKLPAQVGRGESLGEGHGSVKVIRAFENFKMSLEEGKRVVFDAPGPGSNPALEVEVTDPNGQTSTQYVFERFAGHTRAGQDLRMAYQRMVSDYVSELEVVEDGKVVASKDIEVNHPLHYGGYFFYQSDYDQEAGTYTVLSVASDSGLSIIYLGYLLLGVGVFWHFWSRHAGGLIAALASRAAAMQAAKGANAQPKDQ